MVTVDTVAPGTPTVVLLNDSHNHADRLVTGRLTDNLTKFDVLQLELTVSPAARSPYSMAARRWPTRWSKRTQPVSTV